MIERFDLNDDAQRVTMEQVHDAVAHFLPSNKNTMILPMSGGFSNANYQIDHTGKKFVLRFCCKGIEFAKREIKVLQFLEQQKIPAPRLLAYKEHNEMMICLLEYIDGTPLSEMIPGIQQQEVFQFIGATLAAVHRFEFPAAGYFTVDGSLDTVFSDFSKNASRFLLNPLDDLAGKRLGAGVCRKLQDLVKNQWSVVEETFRVPTLTHCDFNPKNILISGPLNRPRISIIDWEFTISGHHLIDFGNFFRFANEDYSAEACHLFLKGYRDAGGKLEQNWEKAALLLDLTSMVFFLNNRKEQPITFQTAKLVIERTLQAFNRAPT